METSHFKKRLFRKVLQAFLFLGSTLFLNAAENEQQTPSTITNVTVFLNQAQVTRVAKVNLQAGITNLVFKGLSSQMNMNSLQVRVDGTIVLLAVSSRDNFLNTLEKSPEIILLEDSLKSLTIALSHLKADKETIVFQKELMLANRNVGSNQIGVKSDELEDLMALYKKKLTEFKDDWIKLSLQEDKYNGIKHKMESQLNELRGDPNLNVPEVVITLKTLEPSNNALIELSYLVNNASWVPFYDVRVKDTKSELQLVSKAYITQGTGENWKNVILKLSTANPNEGGNKPELQTNFIGYQTLDRLESAQVIGRPKMRASRSDGTAQEDDATVKWQEIKGIATVQQSAVNIEFTVTSTATIPSDNNPHQVDLTVNNLKADYAYGAVPKLDKDVFATAKVAGNDLVNQVSGEANVYFDGTFVGKSFINGTTSDSVLISLGRDKRIQIQRNQLKDFSSRSLSGGSKKELSTWEITIRNTRKENLTILIEDQIPVSTDKEIEVKLLNASGANYDETNGKLSWLLTLEPEKSVSLKFSYEVKYPKEKIINGY